MRSRGRAAALGAVALAAAGTAAPAAPPPQAPAATRPADVDRDYADVLAAVVDEHGLLRYDRLEDDALWSKLRDAVSTYGRAALPQDGDELKARLCNAYNANVLRLAVAARKAPGFVDVQHVEGFFDARPIRVGGATLTLNDLENRRLRPLGDPRIHAALVCAAMSCPPLRSEPYRGAVLDAQLDDQCRRWVRDPARNGVSDGAASVSRIFQWYGEDFAGPPWLGVAGFLRRYADPDSPLGRLLAGGEPRIDFREYDWSLNLSPADGD